VQAELLGMVMQQQQQQQLCYGFQEIFNPGKWQQVEAQPEHHWID
jgi:hypothetical protein